MRHTRDISKLPKTERDWYLENTWCDFCQKADLGLENPALFEEDGKVFIEGNCRICGNTVKSEIIEKGFAFRSRPVLQSETDVIVTALSRAPLTPYASSLAPTASSLVVRSQCGCGCASVEFEGPSFDEPPQPIADATGRLKSGELVQVLIFGNEDAVTALEVICSSGGAGLPDPGTLKATS